MVTWSQFFNKIRVLHFGNFVLDNNSCDKINDNLTKKIYFWNKKRLNQILLLILWARWSNILKYIKKEIEKIIFNFPYIDKKNTANQTPGSVLGISDLDNDKCFKNQMNSKIAEWN